MRLYCDLGRAPSERVMSYRSALLTHQFVL
jgi:hypothetical protein